MATQVEHLRGAFGQDRFGQEAERFARFFGTPRFIIGQTILVVLWIIVNGLGNMPTFGDLLTDDDVWSAVYAIREVQGR